MNLVTASCGVNQTYSITEDAFQQLIEQCVQDTPFVKLANEPRISFEKDQSNVSFVIDIKIKNKKSIETAISTLENEINNRFEGLLEIKPRSIRICFVGNY